VRVTGDVEIDAKRFQSQPQPSGRKLRLAFLLAAIFEEATRRKS
jgi:hypothetical protein